MKQICLIVCIILCSFLSLTGQSIKITNPHSLSKLEQSKPFVIRWTTSGSLPDLTIYLESRPSGKLTRLVHPYKNSGQYRWNVPANQGIGNYRILIRPVGSALKFYSDIFKVIASTAPKPELEILSPNGGEKLKVAHDDLVSWRGKNITGNVDLLLYKGSRMVRVIASNKSSTGSFVWPVGVNASPALVAGNDYRVAVRSMVDPKIIDFSNGYFSIAIEKPTFLNIIAPRNGDRWAFGSKQTIKYETKGLTGPVSLILYLDKTLVGMIAQGLPNGTRTYSWQVGKLISGKLPQGTRSGYNIFITCDKSGFQSPNKFTITQIVNQLPAQGTVGINQPRLSTGIVPKQTTMLPIIHKFRVHTPYYERNKTFLVDIEISNAMGALLINMANRKNNYYDMTSEIKNGYYKRTVQFVLHSGVDTELVLVVHGKNGIKEKSIKVKIKK